MSSFASKQHVLVPFRFCWLMYRCSGVPECLTRVFYTTWLGLFRTPGSMFYMCGMLNAGAGAGLNTPCSLLGICRPDTPSKS
jgi:hypothetical protein